MKIKAITIEITGQQMASFGIKITGLEMLMRKEYALDEGLHLVSLEQKVKGSDRFDAYVCKFEREKVMP